MQTSSVAGLYFNEADPANKAGKAFKAVRSSALSESRSDDIRCREGGPPRVTQADVSLSFARGGSPLATGLRLVAADLQLITVCCTRVPLQAGGAVSWGGRHGDHVQRSILRGERRALHGRCVFQQLWLLTATALMSRASPPT